MHCHVIRWPLDATIDQRVAGLYVFSPSLDTPSLGSGIDPPTSLILSLKLLEKASTHADKITSLAASVLLSSTTANPTSASSELVFMSATYFKESVAQGQELELC